ncbi:MAG TPA: hypothetical protein VFE90_02480 [Myxococcales bacterium]|nr:hypothetical protein [Myxococcales bacterium]
MAALACIALAGNGVRAQEASGKDKEALEDARQHVAKAKVHYDLGEYKDAAEEYIIVYRLKPLPALLFNIAQSYRQAGMYDKARSFYKSYLREAPEVKNRATIEQSIKEMDELLAKEKKAKNGPPTGVKEPMGSTAAEASLPIKKMARAPEKAAAVDAAAAKPLSAPGTSAPTAAAQNQPAKATEPPKVAMATPAAQTPAKAVPAVAVTPAPGSSKTGSTTAQSGSSHTAAWIAGGAAVALLGGGALFTLKASGTDSDLQNGGHTRAEADSLISQSNSNHKTSAVLLGVGAVAAATSAVLFLAF